MSPAQRRGGLVLAVLATALAIYFSPGSETESTSIVAPIARRTRVVQAEMRHEGGEAPLQVLEIRPRQSDDAETQSGTETARVFGARQWTPPPAAHEPAPAPVSQEPAAPPPPQAPTLPFRFLGRYAEAGRDGVFLQHQNQNLVVHVGDTIAGEYKVERLDASQLTLRYLPMDQTQSMDIGSTH